MALDALWAVLIPEVSKVSEVQTPFHMGLRDTPAVLLEVLRVSSNDYGNIVTAISGGADTRVTPTENARYQGQLPWTLGCTLDNPDTPEKFIAEVQTGGTAATHAQSEPKRLFRQRGPWLTGREQVNARTYHAHHFKCPACIAAGRAALYGDRCAVGAALWRTYSV